MPAESSHAVFLSYASQDALAARRICEGLRSAGIEVWFDQSDLRGGDAWDQAIRRQIRDCALFIPVISDNTAARAEGYFRLEWTLADQRTHMMSRSKTFIVPVCVDATPDTDADVPDSFLRAQWTRLPAGEASAQFAAHVKTLLGLPTTAGLQHVADPPAAATRLKPVTAAARRNSRLFVGLGLGACALLVAMVLALRTGHVLPAAGLSHVQTAAGDSAAAGEKSVAVLPFADMSERHDQEYFSDGLSEELIDVLTKIPNLRVPARTSSFSFKGKSATVGEIAHELGVTHVLEGSVRKSGDHMRITAQLVRADNGFHLWSQTYDRQVQDIFTVQDEIANAVAEQLKTALLIPADAAKQTTSTEAHNLFLQARYVAERDTPADLSAAIVLYEQALKADPKYAQAWAWLSYAHIRSIAQGSETDTAEAHARTTDAARRAIQLDPGLPEGYTSLATAIMQFERDWPAATQALDKAAALDPGNTLMLQVRGHLSAAIGAPGEAVGYFRRSVDADPLNILQRKYLGRALYYSGKPEAAAEELRRAIALNPQFPGLHYELGRALLQLKQTDAAVAAFEAEPAAVWRLNGLPLGYISARRQKEAQATTAACVADPAGGEFQIAEIFAFMGQADKSFEWLERARTSHDPGLMWIRNDPLLASIAGDPRFAAFLTSIGMPPP